MRQRVMHRIDDRGQDGIGELAEPVVNPQPFASRLDEAGPTKIREVARRLRLRDLEALVDVADADLAGQQQSQDTEPRGVGERFEQGFHLSEWLRHIRVDKYNTPRL